MDNEAQPKNAKPWPWPFIACGAVTIALLLLTAGVAVHNAIYIPKGATDWQTWGALWAALATFATGLLAVGAALFVGIRQLSLQEKQTEILVRQAEIQEQQIESERKLRDREMKIQLLQMRSKAINELGDFYRSHAHTPGTIDENDRRGIFDALNLARLIFPEDTASLFEKCIKNVNWRKANLGTASELHSVGYHAQAVTYDMEAIELTSTIMSDFDELLKSMIAHARVDL